MHRYVVGERVVLSAERESGAVPNRVEVDCPDGSRRGKDWDLKTYSITPETAGIWKWRVFVRDHGTTTVQSGDFEVVAEGGLQIRIALLRRIAARVRARFGQAGRN